MGVAQQKTEKQRNLIRDDVEWSCTEGHEKKFEELKRVVTKDPVLQVFDLKKKITILTDNSKEQRLVARQQASGIRV